MLHAAQIVASCLVLLAEEGEGSAEGGALGLAGLGAGLALDGDASLQQHHLSEFFTVLYI